MPRLGDIHVRYLKGVGEKRGEILAAHGITTVEDLLYWFPRRYLDRTTVKPLREVREGDEATIVGKVVSCDTVRGKKSRFVALISDETGFVQCVWFHSLHLWKKIIRPGSMFAFNGKFGYFNGLQLVHPEFDKIDTGGNWNMLNTGTIIPLYPSNEQLSQAGYDSRGLRRVMRRALDSYSNLIEETLPEELVRNRRLLPLAQALQWIHFPAKQEELHAAQKRLKFDELFYLELILALRRKNYQSSAVGIAFKNVGDRVRQLIDNLPFTLTGAQQRALREIWEDMKSPLPMNRLVQGDVGSGKTMVALISMLLAVENGYQAAMMAPTEILAEQHYLNIYPLLDEVGVNTVLLVGGQKKKLRERFLGELKDGVAQVAVGTHALIQDEVQFKRLGLVVVDEQHRFGVLQRMALRDKGEKPDVLVMTATPIPRTLSMTLYGDLDLTVIDELPSGRKPVRTVWRPSHKRQEIYHFIRDELVQGKQAFIVFPLVEESEKIDLRAATETYEKVKQGFFENFEVGLLHGRMTSQEKEQVMAEFKAGRMQVLIATTVIEVGVDVPNASIMVIEHAERFGLTQLHQLRGRVGRGSQESLCILVADTPLSREARLRINTMCETNDGFRIAEVDLEIRGPGEFLGTRQHGLPDFRIADLVQDRELLEKARSDAFAVVEDEQRLKQVVARANRYGFFKRFREKMELAEVG